MSKTAIASVLTLLAAGCGESKDEGIAGCDEVSDADSDGLNDCEEEALGSDPAKDDTDGDGLTNYAELVTHGTKVDDNDTDNDGLLDNEEIQIGTDPKISNSNIVNFLNSKA